MKIMKSAPKKNEENCVKLGKFEEKSMKIDESWGKLGKIKENWKSCENWRSCKNLKNCENWMKLAKIGVNWSAEVDENWWKLMKIEKVVKIG